MCKFPTSLHNSGFLYFTCLSHRRTDRQHIGFNSFLLGF